ncbi:MAG: hypothetical protein PHV82_07930, partial [Victivallaceae bacterium]|nr:hypothetical protein [Victivallaceae bacterium]
LWRVPLRQALIARLPVVLSLFLIKQKKRRNRKTVKFITIANASPLTACRNYFTDSAPIRPV